MLLYQNEKRYQNNNQNFMNRFRRTKFIFISFVFFTSLFGGIFVSFFHVFSASEEVCRVKSIENTAPDALKVCYYPPPLASDLSVNKGDYCCNPAHFFSWKYSDPAEQNEIRFQFQVDNNSDFSSPEVNRDYSGLSNPSPTINNQAVSVYISPGSDQIKYNTTYYWRVNVYDSWGDDSGWTNGSSFTTEEHHYPSPDFDWSPTKINKGEEVDFTNKSTCYNAFNNAVSCSSWQWNITSAVYLNGTDFTSQDPSVEFTSVGSKTATLHASDEKYSCYVSHDMDVYVPLPHWKEVAP